MYERQYAYAKRNPEKYRAYALAYYYKNKDKAAIKAKRWRENNKDYIRDKQRAVKRDRKNKAIEYLGGVCKDCGGKFHPAVFEFHHLDPNLKERDPSKMLNMRWERLTKELDNCALLCANCHRLRHHVWENS